MYIYLMRLFTRVVWLILKILKYLLNEMNISCKFYERLEIAMAFWI